MDLLKISDGEGFEMDGLDMVEEEWKRKGSTRWEKAS